MYLEVGRQVDAVLEAAVVGAAEIKDGELTGSDRDHREVSMLTTAPPTIAAPS